jgi:hypothetical protein
VARLAAAARAVKAAAAKARKTAKPAVAAAEKGTGEEGGEEEVVATSQKHCSICGKKGHRADNQSIHPKQAKSK